MSRRGEFALILLAAIAVCAISDSVFHDIAAFLVAAFYGHSIDEEPT